MPEPRRGRGDGTTRTCSRSSLRATSEAELLEILDAWFGGSASAEPDDVENIAHLGEIERSA